MSQFVCRVCESDHGVRVTDLVITACCEVCGVLRGDWGWKRVALTVGHLFSHAWAARRARLLQNIAALDAELRGRRSAVAARD